jgi:hypothetical protein
MKTGAIYSECSIKLNQHVLILITVE